MMQHSSKTRANMVYMFVLETLFMDCRILFCS